MITVYHIDPAVYPLLPKSSAGFCLIAGVIAGALSCGTSVSCLMRPGGDGLGGSRPGREPVPQRRAVVAGESVVGEGIVVDPVELPAGVSEVTGQVLGPGRLAQHPLMQPPLPERIAQVKRPIRPAPESRSGNSTARSPGRRGSPAR